MQVLKAPIEKILLIDDDLEDCAVFAEALKEAAPAAGFHAINRCVQLAFALQTFKPHLIFLDINLPVVNGFDCLKELKENADHSKIPIVMYSSSQNPKEINIAYGLGATLYFKKPTKFSELVSSLENILDMAWHDPDGITPSYFIDGKYVCFSDSREG